jgi:hypothetical protein
MSDRTLIIDGDLIAYKYAAGAEKRHIVATIKKSGNTKEFKNRTELKKFVVDKGFEFKPEDYEIEDVQEAVDVSIAFNMVKGIIDKLQEATWADNVEIYLGLGKTFRHKLPLPTPYKDNRDTLKPLHLEAVRNYMRKKYSAQLVEEYEVDDVVTIRAYEYLNAGKDAVLASVDKDSYQCQGVTLLNWSKDDWQLELVPDVGELWKDKTTVKGNGLKFLALQTLSGDTADTYCGYKLSNVKYGPTKAMNALLEAKTEQEIMQIMFNEFKRLYPDKFDYTDCHGVQHEADWKSMLQLYWQCAYMKRSWKDPSDVFDFMDERKIVV